MTTTPLKRNCCAGLVAVAAVFASASAHANAAPSTASVNLLRNGSFESTISPHFSQQSGTWDIYKNLFGWKVGSAGVEIRNSFAGVAADGNSFVELDTTRNSWISQSFKTSTSQEYLVSFLYSPRAGVAADSNEIFAQIDGENVFSVTGSGIGASGNVWKEYSFSFVADSNRSTLLFGAGGLSNSYGGSLDAVRVTAVPEPSAWAMMLAGLAGLGLILRRRVR